MPERTRYATLLAFVLIGIGAWRVYAVVGAAPVLGYANQFDMGRISACVGLWPDLSPAARLQAHPEAPSRVTWAVSACPTDATGAASSSSWHPSPRSWPRARP